MSRLICKGNSPSHIIFRMNVGEREELADYFVKSVPDCYANAHDSEKVRRIIENSKFSIYEQVITENLYFLEWRAQKEGESSGIGAIIFSFKSVDGIFDYCRFPSKIEKAILIQFS